MEAGTANFMAMMHMDNELKETEDAALYTLESYERADKQRTELYYQAKSSNSLAAKTLMESLSGAGGEACKALAKHSAKSKWWSRLRRSASPSSRISPLCHSGPCTIFAPVQAQVSTA